MRLDWKAALFFVTSDPGWKRKLLIGGALFYPFPPLGWVLALGFRSLTGPRLVEGIEPVLPEWRQSFGEIFRRGLMAIFVILSHLSPFLLCYWLFGVESAADLATHRREALWFFVSIAVFPPLFLPTLPVVYAVRFSWLSFSGVETAILATLFAGAVFILPASFVQVGLHGGYAAAFRAVSAWRFALLNWREYLEAWAISLAVSAAAVCLGPFMPWGLFWSYLVILHLFMDALVKSDTEEVRYRFARSLLLRPPSAVTGIESWVNPSETR